MNNISIAMKEAGLRLPALNKRVWAWIKDHPNTSVINVSTGINVPRADVSSSASLMTKRNMLTRVRHISNKGQSFYTYQVVGSEFELKPMAKQPIAKTRPVSTMHITPELKPVPEIKPLSESNSIEPKKIDVNSLTLSEAVRIYKELKSFFCLGES